MTARLCECADCGQRHRLTPLPPRSLARCTRCRNILGRHRPDPLQRPLALAVTGLLLLLVALTMPFMTLSLGGRGVTTQFTTGAIALDTYNLWELTAVVLATTVAAPLARPALLIAVLAGLRLRRPPRRLYLLFRWSETLRPWAMVEVYMLGIFVAYSKLADLAHVSVGPAVYALGALMLVTAATDASLDHEAVWEALQARSLVADPTRLDQADSGQGIACLSCAKISRAREGEACPRCGAALHRRKPGSLHRTWAFLIAAAVLYIPANVFPVLTLIEFGRGVPSTILGGVQQLVAARLWSLAILVFVASITVPVLKILGLTLMLLSVHRRTGFRLRDRTVLYRVVDLVGRWSMIDVFMISILTGLVRLGFLADVRPGIGAVAFAAVVILTMLSAFSFDPRLMWDAAHRNPAGERP